MVITSEYTGKSLQDYIVGSQVLQYKKRDFVQAVVEYCISSEIRVLSISGLRGTGKTTGILQAAHMMDDMEHTVFITIDETSDMDCLDLRNLLLEKYSDKKYILIDEITRVKDLVSHSAFLADTLCMSGRKVVISGTDSLALAKMEYAGLYHRVIDINVTHISYAEAHRTAGQTLKEYIDMGGLYRAQAITDIEGLRQYIDTAVIDNIMNTLTRNPKVTSLLNIQDIDVRKLRTIVFRIIYAIIYMNTQKIKPTSVKFMIDLYDYSKSSLYNAKNLNSLVCAQMGIDEEIDTNIQETGTVLDALQTIGLVVKTENLYCRAECNYYITNPSVVNQLLKNIAEILDTTGLDKRTHATVRRFKGLLFESIIVAHTKKTAEKYGNQVYFYHDISGAEIDLIVEKVTGNAFEDLYLYYEIKMTSDIDTAIIKARWPNDAESDSFVSGRVLGRSIIYGGESGIFKGFADQSSIYPPPHSTISQIEQQNMNTELISAEEYLLHTEEKLSILERCGDGSGYFCDL